MIFGFSPSFGKEKRDFDASRDFSPRVNFRCRLSYSNRTPPCALACINICAHVEDPVVRVRVRCIMETLKQNKTKISKRRLVKHSPNKSRKRGKCYLLTLALQAGGGSTVKFSVDYVIYLYTSHSRHRHLIVFVTPWPSRWYLFQPILMLDARCPDLDRFSSTVHRTITAYLASVRPAMFHRACSAHLSILRCVSTCPWLAAL